MDVEQLAQLRVELAAANAGRAELRAELDRQVAAAGEIEDLRVQVAELRGMADQVAALEAAAVQADQRLAAVVDEREALRQHADELRVHLAEQGVMADQIVALQAAASSAEQQLAVATDERDALQQHAEQMDSELAAAVGARDEACAQLEELRVHAVGQGGMAEQVAALEAAAVQAEQRLALITEERNALREQAAAAANRHEEIDLHSGELEALRTELATAAAERDELRQQRAAGDVRAQTDLEQRLATLETRLEGALDTLEGFGADRSIVDELEQRLAAAAATNREAAHAILALEGRLAEAHDELARQQPATTQRLADSQYFVFLSAVGAYALVERQGRIPQPGETLTVDGIAHVVSRVGWTLGADRPTVHTIPV